jgi:hypothetical protein
MPAIEEYQKTVDTHPATPSRESNYSDVFEEHGSGYLIANGKYCDSLPKGPILINLKNRISKGTA